MTKKEFLVIVKGLKSVYSDPKFLAGKDAIDVWYGLLCDLPYQVLSLATQKYMMQEQYPPTIAGLRKKAAEITAPVHEDMSELEAWSLVRKALGNSAYNAESEFDKLPELCQKAVGNAANLHEMALMDTDTVNSVEQSHFIRNYRAALDRKRADAQVSPGIMQLIQKAKTEALEESDCDLLESGDDHA